uniref:Uncharacterized protein n=1 Tax=Leersia perrieri TaxID=77586 RepID=A0A0D9VGY9_9ORYZ
MKKEFPGQAPSRLHSETAPPPPAAPAAGVGKRKRSFSEDDAYLVLHRYQPATILTMMQEMGKHVQPGRRGIDWRALVRRTSTGITSPREYQMLWRHFAYGHELVESVVPGALPLEDDSDLECDIEIVPTPGNEALAEATSFAKSIISGSSREQASGQRVNSEANALNTQNEKIVRVPSDKQLVPSQGLTNGTGPVSSLKQPSNAGSSSDPFESNGHAKKKKKPKPWSKEEDGELAAGVQKYGEGKWQDILDEYRFDSSRSYLQLQQRWAFICKRQGSTKPANHKPVNATSSEDLNAAKKTYMMFIDMPMKKKSGPQHSVQHNAPMFTTTPEVKPAVASLPLPSPSPVVPVPSPSPVVLAPSPSPVVPAPTPSPPPQLQQAPAQSAPPPSKVSNASNKTRNNSKKQVAQPSPVNNGPLSLQAIAFAAGGRIATPSVATNLLKAAQSTKAVHIRSRGTGSSKSSTGSKTPSMAGEPGTQIGSAQYLELQNTSGSSPVLTTHATEQVPSVSEVAGVTPLGQSDGVHLSETKKPLNTMPVSGTSDKMEIDDNSNYFAVTMEDLFPEDTKQEDAEDHKTEEAIDPKDADMLEFDRFVAQGCLNKDYVDKSKTVKVAPEVQGVVSSQKKQPKTLPTVGKSNPISAGATVTTKKTKSPVPQGGMSSGIVAAGNVGVLNRSGGKAHAPTTTATQNTVQKQQNTSSKGNVPKIVAPGTVAPANNRANTAVNGASKANVPASQKPA